MIYFFRNKKILKKKNSLSNLQLGGGKKIIIQFSPNIFGEKTTKFVPKKK